MADTTFVNGTVVEAAWLNDVNDCVYRIRSVADYATTAVAITDAIANDIVLLVHEDLTVQIPTDAATMQIAIDRLSPINNKLTITLNIESGHSPSTTVVVAGRDCSAFRITSTDAEVTLAAAYSGTLFTGTNGARMPRLATLFNATTQTSGNGISLNASDMVIESGKGVKNAYGNGLGCTNGCVVAADGAIFTGCARNGVTGAGITSWGSDVSAEGANVSDSLFYGAQAAHGGRLTFRDGIANDCYRHGIRATDAAMVDADGASANDCAVDTTGYAVYAYQAGIVNFVDGSATGCLGTAAVLAFGAGSAVNAEGATITGATGYGVQARRGGVVNVQDATVTGSGTENYYNYGGTIHRSEQFIAGAPLVVQTCVIASGDISFDPSPTGHTYLKITNEGGAASDNLDTITPNSPLTIAEGHIVYLRTVSSAQDAVLRDVTTSAAAGNYALHTPSDASLTLSTSVAVAAFLYNGGSWSLLYHSAN
jgi:hypothetical protein